MFLSTLESKVKWQYVTKKAQSYEELVTISAVCRRVFRKPSTIVEKRKKFLLEHSLNNQDSYLTLQKHLGWLVNRYMHDVYLVRPFSTSERCYTLSDEDKTKLKKIPP